MYYNLYIVDVISIEVIWATLFFNDQS